MEPPFKNKTLLRMADYVLPQSSWHPAYPEVLVAQEGLRIALVAIGSKVPAWPILRSPRIPRHLATTSWLVQPPSLSTSKNPSVIDCLTDPSDDLVGVETGVKTRRVAMATATE